MSVNSEIKVVLVAGAYKMTLKWRDYCTWNSFSLSKRKNLKLSHTFQKKKWELSSFCFSSFFLPLLLHMITISSCYNGLPHIVLAKKIAEYRPLWILPYMGYGQVTRLLAKFQLVVLLVLRSTLNLPHYISNNYSSKYIYISYLNSMI